MQQMSQPFEMRLDREALERIDAWRADEVDLPSRAEAVRRLVNAGLGGQMSISDGEKLTIWMLNDLLKHLHVETNLDMELIREVIESGHLWALSELYPGIFREPQHAAPAIVDEVREILMMWSFIEQGLALLSSEEQTHVHDEAPLAPAFRGFDGTIEAEHLLIAGFLIRIHSHQNQSFGKFAGRDLDSHMPMLDTYRRMVPVFCPMVAPLMYLTAGQIVDLLRAMVP